MKLLQSSLVVLLLNFADADWWESGSYYQIYPRSFKDSDGDGIGDLRGIAEKLDYLKDLGITATWLSPIYKSPLVDYGYDISDFCAVGPEYGTIEDFEFLMAMSKETGVRVLLDFVPNHTSDEHEWFGKSINGEDPYTDYYVWHPGKVDPNDATKRIPPSNWQSIGGKNLGDAWTWNDKRQAFYYHQFAVQQPDLNFRNLKVQEEMKNVLKFWLDKGVAGFRVDAITHMYEVAPDADNNLPDEVPSGNTNDTSDYGYLNHVYTVDQNETFELVYDWRQFLDDYVKENGGDTKILMTESYSAISTVQRYYTDGVKEGAQLPFNFELMKQLRIYSSARDVVTAVHSWLDPMPKGHFTNWVMSNHDGSRSASRMGMERIDLYNALLTLLPGTSVTYYGEEIGMTDVCITVDPTTKEFLRCNDVNSFPFMREFCRVPFQWDNSAHAGFSKGSKTWLPVSENFQTVNVAAQNGRKGSHFEVFKKLMALRKSEAATNGSLIIEALNDEVLLIRRHLDDSKQESLISILNFGSQYTNLNFINQSAYPATLSISLSRLNSFHDVGTKMQLRDVKLAPFDVLVGTYGSAANLIFHYPLSILVLVAIILQLKF